MIANAATSDIVVIAGQLRIELSQGCLWMHVMKKSIVGVKGALRPKPFLCGAIWHDDLPGGDLSVRSSAASTKSCRCATDQGASQSQGKDPLVNHMIDEVL